MAVIICEVYQVGIILYIVTSKLHLSYMAAKW